MRPQMAQGVQSGDPRSDAAMVWTRSDRPARMWVDCSTTASFAHPTRVRGPYLMEGSDFTGRLDLASRPAGQQSATRRQGRRRPRQIGGFQFFGQVDIDAKTRAMTVTLKDLTGASLFVKMLEP